ncbi:MAG: NUDIX domain-containing protein [Saprospiraceae bacterium]|nr:NUDIX domain-containing protein [Saprospiraceae bacterium]
MMGKSSAGIVLYRTSNETVEILLGHMGGPFWAKKDEHAWTIPKGEFDPDEESAIDAAKREFKEETGLEILDPLRPMDPFLKNNKKHYFFLLEKNVNPEELKCNSFEMEWPPKSGKLISFPELDRFAWFDLKMSREKIVKGQLAALDQLNKMLH